LIKLLLNNKTHNKMWICIIYIQAVKLVNFKLARIIFSHNLNMYIFDRLMVLLLFNLTYVLSHYLIRKYMNTNWRDATRKRKWILFCRCGILTVFVVTSGKTTYLSDRNYKENK